MELRIVPVVEDAELSEVLKRVGKLHDNHAALGYSLTTRLEEFLRACGVASIYPDGFFVPAGAMTADAVFQRRACRMAIVPVPNAETPL